MLMSHQQLSHAGSRWLTREPLAHPRSCPNRVTSTCRLFFHLRCFSKYTGRGEEREFYTRASPGQSPPPYYLSQLQPARHREGGGCEGGAWEKAHLPMEVRVAGKSMETSEEQPRRRRPRRWRRGCAGRRPRREVYAAPRNAFWPLYVFSRPVLSILFFRILSVFLSQTGSIFSNMPRIQLQIGPIFSNILYVPAENR